MRRSIVSLFSFLAIALIALTGCQEPQNSIPGSVDSISVRVIDSTDAKTITPEGNVNISHYVITVVNEAEGINQSSGYLTKGSMFTVSNVPAGTWYAKVDAYIERGEDTYVKVASDQSEPKTVQAGASTTFELVLDTLDAVASGNVTVTLKMPAALDNFGTSFWYQYTIVGMTNEEFSYTSKLLKGVTSSLGLAYINLNAETLGLMQGAYRFEITIQNDEASPTLTSKGVDVMRLVNGLEAKGTIDFTSYEPDQLFGIKVTDKIGNIIAPTTHDGKENYELIPQNGEMTFIVVLAEPLTSSQTIEWYVNGELDESVDTSEARDGKYMLVFASGYHNITAIIRDVNTQMAVGSISFRTSSIEIAEQMFTFDWNGSRKIYIITGLAQPIGEFEMPESGVLEIPSTYQGKPVTAIGSEAFRDRTDIVGSVLIPDSVTTIDESAFEGCSALTSINIPDGVTSIRRYAFSGCSSLTEITIPDGVASIGDNAFEGCSALTSVNIPDGVTSIGRYAFSGCSSLTEITIPDGVTSIGDNAFSGCSSLTNIDLPATLKSIGDFAFASCSNLTEIIIPEGVTTLNAGTFANCTNLSGVSLPSTLKTIESEKNTHGVFESCVSLTKITIPDGVTSIGRQALEECTGLTSILIPESVISIEDSIFDYCFDLIVYCEVSSEPEGWDEDWLGFYGSDVFWGVSRSEYDAIMNNDSVPYTVPEPAISVDGGNATITCDKAFAHIYYTIDGADPTADNGTLYETPFSAEIGQTIRAVAYVGNGIYSTVAEYQLK